MCGNRNILLDATVRSVLSTRAFRAELGNGHAFTAFVHSREAQVLGEVRPGDRVRVEMSSFDMSKGRIRCGTAERG
jgi:translation initiation factor IF-1